MKFFLPLRHGLATAARRPKLILLVYLLSLLPAAVVALLAYFDMAGLMNDSLFAGLALAGERMAVWNDYQRADASGFGMVNQAALILAGFAVLLHILTAAGVVEALLHREHERERPFLLGIGRHGWRFTRSAIWFGIALVPLLVVVGASFGGINKLAEAQMDGRVHLAGWLAVLVVSMLIYMFLDLGYDLSRIAAATHDEGRTLFGYVKAFFHALRHPLILAPFWLLLSLLVVGLHLAYVAGRAAVQPENLLHVALVLLVQQVVFLVAAFLRVALWSGEIAYYQAAGEPRWCGKRQKPEQVDQDHSAAEDTEREWGPEPEPEAVAAPVIEPEAVAAPVIEPEPDSEPSTETERENENENETWDRRPDLGSTDPPGV